MDAFGVDKCATLKELHGDLARKYKKHASRIESVWLSLTRGQRIKCLKAGAKDGEVLRHPFDSSMGNVCKFIPEWNSRDVSEKVCRIFQVDTEASINREWAAIEGSKGG